MKKRIIGGFLVVLCLILTGCSNNNTSVNKAYTSVYPTEYLLEKLYGNSVEVYSIYPEGMDYNNYKLSKKQISDYSLGELFVYNSTIEKEKNYAVKLLNNNKNMKVIDASLGMSTNYDISETWLDPSNFLMMASNIKQGLKEYVNEKYKIEDSINKNYEKLKEELSGLDAELKESAEASNNPTLVVTSNAFKFLEKYGFKVYSLQDEKNLSGKDLGEIKSLMANGTIKYIFLKDKEEESELVKSLKSSYNVQVLRLNSLSTISADDRKNNKDYISIMEDNISSIRLEAN